ncbi:peptide chain release factor N(5)-glutamine methyltransferase [Mogibacterium timidum]|uniref:Release factor glutamine methyltransferase n=1 Tax=Mogibacterium timidum ATCC 33093 TaxID=1401079 RepID=X8ISC4_9FIRM|nr:peptide chain release factor N(5)-glutamine methyltransferase [Mogibacterium timidum]EUC52715.1 protein-(glutamine-N5) methyltransferase, release factor-specific [Mogibacterium timidum ATCC 33093]
MDYSKIFIKDAKPTKIGGQAVMEGVMMRGEDKQALAVRLPNGDIRLEIEDMKGPSKVSKVPFVRGIVSFFSSLVYGMKTLMRSTRILEEAMPEDEVDSSKLEEWLDRKFGNRTAWNVMLTISVLISLLITIAVFVIFPTYSVNVLKHVTKNSILLNLAEGILRLLIFVLYVLLISKMNDVRRLFRYHGAEHKTIHCYENGLELTPENAKGFYTLHPRCGTSFVMFVLIISLILFSFLGWPNLVWRIASRLLLMPVIAGISYELLKWAGRSDNVVIKVLSWPGLMMQKLTTGEPDEDQLEVAIVSLRAVLGELEPGIISASGDTAGAEARDADGEAEAEESIFDALDNKRYDEDVAMVRNLVREGRKKLQVAGVSNPDGDADDIFCYVTGFTHNEIITRNTELLSESDMADYRERILERASGMPLQYITRVQEFMGLPFRVNENVLIPRLDTEVLVDQVLGIIGGMELEHPDVLDMCTGSGAIGVSIAHMVPDASVKMTDISEQALATAMKNAELNGVLERSSFALGNMFSALRSDEQFDIIVSNPPYIKSDIIETLAPEVKDHEPRLALDGGEDGLDAYKVIANNAAAHLKDGGVLALEIGYDQGEAVVFLLERTHYYKPAAIIKDLAGKNRVVVAEKPGTPS